MKKNLITAIIAVGAQIVGAQNLVPQQSQTIIYVKPNGTGDGSSWANACNLECVVGHDAGSRRGEACLAPTTNAQIWVQKGTYYPSKMLIIPDSVRMFGGFSGTEIDLSQRDFAGNPTIIDAQKKFGSVVRLSPFAELNGFTIQNGNSQRNPHKNGGGIWADDNSMIANCKIINNSASVNGGGLYAKGPVKVENCTIENNIASGKGANVYGNCISGMTMLIINTQPNTDAQSKSVGTAFPALSVSVAGATPYSYQWYSNTANDNTSGTPIQGAIKASYTPPSTTIGTRYYYCKITNAYGSATSNVSGLHTVPVPNVAGCVSGTFNLGTISFASATTYTVGSQTWSDVVVASNCNKTGYDGGATDNFNSDCRNATNGFNGHYFSWCAVAKYASTLCPAPWRVPTMDDFVTLDKALGGTGANGQSLVANRYMGTSGSGASCTNAGGTWGGSRFTALATNLSNARSDYWSLSEYNATNAYHLNFNSSYVYPQYNYGKNNGFALRCVR